MKHKKIIIAAAALVIGAGLVVLLINILSPQQVISGRVTSISNGCWADGICGVTLDDSKSIVTGCGLMPDGKTCKTYDQSKLRIGQQVKATVIKTEEGRYNLECDSCKIRVIGE
jgi:hypothetical protein